MHADARAMDQNVYSPKSIDGRGDRLINLGTITNIGVAEQNVLSLALELPNGFVSHFVIDVDDDPTGSSTNEATQDHIANSPRRSTDDRDFTVELAQLRFLSD